MISVIPVDLWLSHAFQGLGDRYIPVMSTFTWLGYPQAYMIAVAIIYWSVDRTLGLRLALFLPVVASLNSILKQAFHAPRPFWVDPGIEAIRVTNGFGMPSGHAQSATVWVYAAVNIKRTWFWVLAVVMTLMIGLSRIYLGVHFSSQVLAGWLTGIVVLVLFSRYEEKFLSWFLGLKFSVQILWLMGITAGIFLLGAVSVLVTRGWEMPPEWIGHAADELAGTGESILGSRGLVAVAGNCGGFLGAALGALFIHRRGGFDPGGPWMRLLRSVTGLILLTGIYFIFLLISPDPENDMREAAWRFSGFFVISLVTLYLYPLLFDRFRRPA
ncbi:MAG: phosphatase PAP2 family protein [Bacteroidales bacterium]